MFFSSCLRCAQTTWALVGLMSLVLLQTVVTAGPQQHCGNSFRIIGHARTKASTVECITYANEYYTCDLSTCHGGSEKDNPGNRPLSKFAYRRCRLYDAKDKLGPADKTVYPTAIYPRNSAMLLNVFGAPQENSDTIAHYNCDYKSTSDVNNRRPWCSNCMGG
ncbi:hypothetical protein PCANC_10050 [Puccinia coronata f. sp. avenae]|uniref:Secreted protein n=1 Tax=Puccinia coronata f. sp. avenae TaxID=200324 RepID=A0A2N5V0C8_9BASI|nr:hypothetical protein PCANC_10050 [Puccinia coronata f. sp. avenae]